MTAFSVSDWDRSRPGSIESQGYTREEDRKAKEWKARDEFATLLLHMTANRFRKLALSLPDTIEAEHMDHPDFRVGGKIFATLGPGEKWGMVKLTLEQQQAFMKAEPEMFDPCSGAWGRRGSTSVRLEHADETTVRRALITAWRNTAPKRLYGKLEHRD